MKTTPKQHQAPNQAKTADSDVDAEWVWSKWLKYSSFLPEITLGGWVSTNSRMMFLSVTIVTFFLGFLTPPGVAE